MDQPPAWWRRTEHTLQKRDLDILAIHGHASPVFQLHKAVVPLGQANSD